MGSKFIDRLSADLQEKFPDIKGFSSRNLKNMRRFASEYPDKVKNMTKPIGVAEYKILQEIPSELKGSLPSIDEIEQSIDIEE